MFGAPRWGRSPRRKLQAAGPGRGHRGV